MPLITRRLVQLPTSMIASLDSSILSPPFHFGESIRPPVSSHEEQSAPIDSLIESGR